MSHEKFIPPPTQPSLYRTADERGSFQATWKGAPYLLSNSDEEVQRRWHLFQTGGEIPRTGPAAFNHGVRRDPIMLLSGDLPRFALVETPRLSHISPPFWKFGDLRIRVTVADHSVWLDEQGNIETTYQIWGTVHRISIAELSIQCEIVATLLADGGMLIQVTVNRSQSGHSMILDLLFGGVGLGQKRCEFPEYFNFLPNDKDTNVMEISGAEVSLQDAVIPHAVRAKAWSDEPVLSYAEPGLDGQHRVCIRQTLRPGETTAVVRFAAVRTGLAELPADEAAFDAAMTETKEYYRDLLETAEVRTPDPILDAGFNAAVVNMEYTYLKPAWLEGLSSWASYFSDNFQISAAIALGQLDQARAALLYFGNHPLGPGRVYNADGSADPKNLDGLPYYILQLHRYWQATHDAVTLAQIWTPLCATIEQFMKERDPDGDDLLDWHTGCNAFLYQADHLSLPGKALSPTIMMAGMFDRMAEMARAHGETPLAKEWQTKAERMRQAAIHVLWKEDEGRFCSCEDPCGERHIASYYTDYVFPVLYGGLSASMRRRCLEALDNDLWISECLMRTGNYLPHLFGNNGIHQVGLSEAAEAYAAEGRAERAWALLHGTARSSVALTDRPGEFYEFASLRGYGTLNTPFGNCAGAFLQGLIGGMFGLEPAAPGPALRWHPAIPANWNESYLRIRQTLITTRGRAGDRIYHVCLAMPQALELTVPLFGGRVASVLNKDGSPLSFSQLDNGSIRIDLPPAAEHEVRIALLDLGEEKVLRAPERITPASPAPLPGQRIAIDLTKSFNADKLPAVNLWGHCGFAPGAELRYELSDLVDPMEGANTGWLQVDRFKFRVQNSGRNLVVLSAGAFDCSIRKGTDTWPAKIRLPVGRVLRGIEWLTASEPKTRLTGMEVGAVIFRSGDREQRMPLVVGRQLDSTLGTYATEAVSRPLTAVHHGMHRHVAAWSTVIKSTEVIDEVVLQLDLPDVWVGVLAANLVI